MVFHVLTLFPEMILQGLHTSILARAMDRGLIGLEAVNIRDHTLDKHGSVDDYTYGGGAGMLMQAQPGYDACMAVQDAIRARRIAEGKTDSGTRVIHMTPQGSLFTQEMARDLAGEEDLIFLCGHYEGIDERALEALDAENVSIGDYVLTGGELPAMVIIDAVSRFVPGVLSNGASAETDSFADGLLEYPQYSRPEEWRGMRVPPVLLSGDHARVDAWRHEQSVARTMERRPDLYRKYLEKLGEM